MARIRTIKPEFWTDGRIVGLPYQARLLFIGLFNFADDHGCLGFEPERIKLQVLPADDVGIESLIDLLLAAELLEWYRSDETNSEFLRIRNWEKHQKVDKPGKSKFPRESSRKLAIPQESRRAVALKYGCEPGKSVDVECYYCGEPGRVTWWNKSNGMSGSWVSTSLSFDHLIAEFDGGKANPENLILACNHCNKSKGHKDYCDYFLAITRESSRGLAVGSRIKDQGSRKGSRKGEATGVAALEPVGPSVVSQTWQAYEEEYERLYRVKPTQNAKVMGQVAQFCKRVPAAEAPSIVRFFLSHPKSFYVQKLHEFGLCLADAESLRTQFLAQTTVTDSMLSEYRKRATETRTRGIAEILADKELNQPQLISRKVANDAQ